MAHFNARITRNKLFKVSIYMLVLGTLALFLSLFTFVGYKGLKGINETTIPIAVDFKQTPPLENYLSPKHSLKPGALKHLYKIYHTDPSFKGIMNLPSYKPIGENSASFASWFFTEGDSRYAEAAGLLNAMKGSFYLLLVVIITALPIGVCAGIYLEELASGRLEWLEVIISNLAAVPSILYGLLGLAIFIYFLDLPRSSAVVGGLTLALMSLPNLVNSTRMALRAVPRNLRDSAKALGASCLQVTFHHVIPYAFPSLMTGILITMARVFGETAPLLIVGLMVFNPVPVSGFFEATTTLPVQIFMWSRNPEPQFIAKAAAAIFILMAFLAIITIIALKFRRSYDQRSS